MGHVFAEIELSNPREPDLLPVTAKALADTGALMLCIPEHVALQLKLETESMREVSVADGRSKNVPYVGPVRVSFGKRFCYVGALVLGDEVLLGAVPMEDMDLVVSPSRREITPDPASPNIPQARAKSLTISYTRTRNRESNSGDELKPTPCAVPVRLRMTLAQTTKTSPVRSK